MKLKSKVFLSGPNVNDPESGLVARGKGDEDMSNLARAIRSLSGLEG